VAELLGHAGLIVRDTIDHVDGGLLASLQRRAVDHGLGLQVHTMPSEGLEGAIDFDTWRSDWRVEGALIHWRKEVPDGAVRHLRRSGMAHVWLNQHVAEDGVTLDEVGAAVEAVRAVHAAGHRRLAFVSRQTEAMLQRDHHAFRDRCRGFRHALIEGALEGRAVLGDAAAPDALHHLLAGDDRPTAIVTPDLRDARLVLFAATRLGLRVPTDLTLVTFYDRPQGDENHRLGVMRIPNDFLGATAMDLLVRRIELGQPVPSVSIGYEPPDESGIAPPPG